MTDTLWQQAHLEAELLNNTTLICRIIQSFLGDLPRAMAAIDGAVALNDAAELAKAAHYLHGSAAQLQLTDLARHCKTLQQDALKNTINLSCLEQLKQSVDAIQTHLNHYLQANHSRSQ
jgi:HPt (histidine-containing phosphotransfer) domain-containing protein